MNIAIGRSGYQVCLLMNTREQKVTIQMYIIEDMEKKNFDKLVQKKEEAEAAIGVSLDWRRLDGKKASTIDLYKSCNLTDAAQRDEIYSWYREYTEKFVSFFKPIVKKL